VSIFHRQDDLFKQPKAWVEETGLISNTGMNMGKEEDGITAGYNFIVNVC
jgi:hypothetical protein